MRAVCAVSAAPARATDAQIPGNPLTIYANDNGQLQVGFAGSATGEFFPPSLAPANAGLVVAYTQASNPQTFQVHGFLGDTFATDGVGDAPPAVTGNGSAASPWVLTTTYHAGSLGMDPAVQIASSSPTSTAAPTSPRSTPSPTRATRLHPACVHTPSAICSLPATTRASGSSIPARRGRSAA